MCLCMINIKQIMKGLNWKPGNKVSLLMPLRLRWEIEI